MKPGKSSRQGIIVVIGVVVILIGLAAHFIYQGFPKFGDFSFKTINEPELDGDLAQTALITPSEGGVVRTIDAAGIISTLRIPAGAVDKEIEVTLTPFVPSETGLNYGVKIEPEIEFTEPATLAFNWRLAEDKAYKKRPFVMSYLPEEQVLATAVTERALVVKNYMPVLITTDGWYGVSDNEALANEAATYTLENESDTLSQLDAGLTLQLNDSLAASDKKELTAMVETISNEEKPNINELYLAVRLEKEFSNKTTWIPQALAYGLFDGYLQFRCNLEETTYEDAVKSMTIAAHLGYTEVEKTCRDRAEELLLERANLVDQQNDRPLIDAVEVLQQMQALGLDDAGSAGEAVANRLNADILASLGEDSEGGTSRENTASDDPLIKNNSTIIQEMVGIGVARFIGLETFDETGLKNLGDKVHQQVSGLNMVADELCNLDDQVPIIREVGAAMGMGMLKEYDQRCEVIQSGKLQKAIDWWEDEVDEYAEGVDAVQKDETPNSGWDDMSELERYMDSLEP